MMHPLLRYTLMTLACIIIAPVFSTYCNAETQQASKSPQHPPKAGDANIPKGNTIKITTINGDIMIQLYSDTAPNTVANFKVLAASGFYDGLTFHRVIAGFMAQGGDPDGNGTGGPGYTINYEYSIRTHNTGSVAMARKPDLDSAGSQFYICFAPQKRLDGQYVVFGQVIEGMDVVNKIKKGDKMLKVTVLR